MIGTALGSDSFLAPLSIFNLTANTFGAQSPSGRPTFAIRASNDLQRVAYLEDRDTTQNRNDYEFSVFDFSTGENRQYFDPEFNQDFSIHDISGDGRFVIYQAFGGPEFVNPIIFVPVDQIEVQ